MTARFLYWERIRAIGLLQKGNSMIFQVSMTVFDVPTNPQAVGHIREIFGETMKKWQESGYLKFSGIYATKRGGTFIFDVNSNDDIFNLVSPLVDYANIDVQPLVSIDTLARSFQNNPPN
jgi:muconolactone delta-isomerase